MDIIEILHAVYFVLLLHFHIRSGFTLSFLVIFPGGYNTNVDQQFTKFSNRYYGNAYPQSQLSPDVSNKTTQLNTDEEYVTYIVYPHWITFCSQLIWNIWGKRTCLLLDIYLTTLCWNMHAISFVPREVEWKFIVYKGRL